MSDVKDYNKYYRLAYDFHARWFPYPADTMKWEHCLDDVRAVSIQNGDNPFLQNLLMNIIEEMQRLAIKKQEA